MPSRPLRKPGEPARADVPPADSDDIRVRPITKFTSSYNFLTNFYPSKVTFEGMEYRTAEHAYQAAKSTNPIERKWVQKAGTAAQARHVGRNRLTLRPNWNAVKVGIMLRILESKFEDPLLRKRLLATGSRVIVEGNEWGDTFWGYDPDEGGGKNILGMLLMLVRESIAQGDPTRYRDHYAAKYAGKRATIEVRAEMENAIFDIDEAVAQSMQLPNLGRMKRAKDGDWKLHTHLTHHKWNPTRRRLVSEGVLQDQMKKEMWHVDQERKKRWREKQRKKEEE